MKTFYSGVNWWTAIQAELERFKLSVENIAERNEK